MTTVDYHALFRSHREHLWGLCYRMTGSAADAEDLVQQTAGVECRKDVGVVDEIPGAYKDIDAVMQNQTDLVDVVHTLKQVLCVKG